MQSQSPQEIKSTDTSSIPPNTTSYFYNANTNQLNHITGQVTNNYLYDARGSITQDSSKAMTISYDYRNMPAGIYHRKTLLGHTVADVLYFYYNAQGQRVKKRFDLKYACECGSIPGGEDMQGTGGLQAQAEALGENSSMSEGGGPPIERCVCTMSTYTFYIYSGSQVIAEYDGNGSLIANYVYGNGQRLAKVDSLGVKSYYHSDYLGSTRIMTNQGATKIFERDYYPFGTELAVYGSGTDYKYNGKEFDDEAGINLYYYGARYYDPKIGRFLSTDPINNYTNPYSYVRNNPINASDPTGMWTEYHPMFSHGGFLFGGFGSDLERALAQWRSMDVETELDLHTSTIGETSCGEYKEVYSYYITAHYGNKEYTVWLDRDKKTGRYYIDFSATGFLSSGGGVMDLLKDMFASNKYKPRDGYTFCNQFVDDFCGALGANVIPHYKNPDGSVGFPYLADALYNWGLSKAVPQDEALPGYLVLWHSNPETGYPSGHGGIYAGGDKYYARGSGVENPGSIEHTTEIMDSTPIFVPIDYVPTGVIINEFGP